MCLNLNNVWKWEIITTVLIEISSYFGRWDWCVFLFFWVHPITKVLVVWLLLTER